MSKEEYTKSLREIEEKMERDGDPEFDREYALAQQQLVPPAELEEVDME
tara:strand:+ start:153 stop:299 length:147 start_codon:yes stop_codon:yes gene_type:complete